MARLSPKGDSTQTAPPDARRAASARPGASRKPVLAIDGGPKTLRRALPRWPQFDRATDAEVLDILHTGQVNYWTGRRGRLFEGVFARWLGVRNAVSVSSGTAALHVALAALGVGPGDEVICTPYSFMASSFCALQAGALPVFADVGDNHLIDPAKIEAAITPRTRAIVVVHLYGMMADMGAIMEIARRRGLFVVEDCAQCLGGEYKGRKAGAIGDIGCFSFCQSKHITTGGEGGMICCDSDALAWECRSLRDHGCDIQARLESSASGGGRATAFRRIGYNFRMTEIQSAIGLGELARLGRWNLPRRAANARRLIDGLAGHPLVARLPSPVADSVPSYWLVPVTLDMARLKDGVTAFQFARALQAEGVGAYGILWPEMPTEPVYRERRGFGALDYPFGDPAFGGRAPDYASARCPVAKRLLASTIGFWVHPTYTAAHINAAVAAFGKVAAAYGKGRA
ncbi:MAG: aminotransferase class V-fold PLP-dependent enzyme [Kiritimatiellae bacterium]|nr:aminotransferase class V-fold PLP-dependent enzyme [Kiritimatiellia bacterium]